MTLLSGRVSEAGLIVDLEVSQTPQERAALIDSGLPITAPVIIPALIDTGASESALDYTVVEGLRLEYWGSVPVLTSTTDPDGENRDEYGAQFVLGRQPNSLILVTGVIAANYATRGYLALIGRDVLCYCVLTYYGPKGEFTLSF